MRRRPKQDKNADELIEAMRALGWYWLDLSAVGGGVPDGIAIRGGRMVLLRRRQPPHLRIFDFAEQLTRGAEIKGRHRRNSDVRRGSASARTWFQWTL